MNSGAGDTTQLVPGFPIRTPWDHSSVDSSPRPIAASHVLHRLLVPRHPPCALSNLTTKMLASTVQFSTNTQPTTTRHSSTPKPGAVLQPAMDRRPEDPTTRLFLQDPTGCPPPPPTAPHAVPTPTKRAVPDARPLPTMTRQCLRQPSNPHRNIRPAQGSVPPSRERRSLERR
jgi:hypothetical protein